ncbi:MAG: PSD1 and planctomycete cytochrome C domain-containing protein [Gemmataceae bacterium]
MIRYTILLLLVAAPAYADGPDFNRDIRPILAQHCLNCHGPDKTTRRARLRLDLQESAHNSVIVPGKPDESELIYRVFSEEPREVMPPPATKKQLTAKQKELLKAWVKAGAKYQKHWAFVAPKREPLPNVKTANDIRNPIDRFLFAKLEKEGLQHSPEADRYTLIRRLSLDLIGLPPTPDEVDAFINDKSDNAYERLVDRLLASPQYGERWARRWLDLARYADTNGYEKDRARTIWPYRDWVIDAINKGMPFDQFTIEQLAGDLLPNPAPEQIVATGFHRNTMINEEGGVDPLEFRYYAIVDRVKTTATTWLGLTMECAQCHTHKYDPITHTEYYQFFAFLNNADEPDYDIPNKTVTERRDLREKQIARLKRNLPQQFPGGSKTLSKRFQEWHRRETSRAVPWQVIQPIKTQTNLPYLENLSDGSVLVGGDQTKSDTYELTFDNDIQNVTALRLEALPHESLPAHGPGRAYYEGRKGDFFLSELSLTIDGKKVQFQGASHDHAKGAFGAGKVGSQFCYDGLPGTGWSTTDQPAKPHEAVFRFATPVDLQKGAKLKMLFERHYSCGLGRFRVAVTTSNKPATATSHTTDIDEILAIPAPDRSKDQQQKLFQRFLEVAPQLAKARRKINQLRASLPKYQTTMVMKERPTTHPRPTHRHHRGEYLQPRERVKADTLSILPPMSPKLPRNRLGLAKWLVSKDNPLTARVVMNRQWQAFFGRGLVKTTEDFGIQGELPTHPKLLDWLALEFQRRDWSMKKMHKLIVMSATYRQSSRVTKDQLAKDPKNLWLARGPRIRLDAEVIRDSLLRASGHLSTKMGGPSVFPPQPKSVTTEGVYRPINWKVSPGEDRFRRGLYTFLKRSIPYAMFSTFDGANGETCLSRREISNTPLQALTMLNDQVIVEAAQTLGKKIAVLPGSTEDRATTLFRRCLTRVPTPRELENLVQFYRTQHTRLKSGSLDAKTIAGTNSPNVIDQAAWTLLARAVFNLDEMITKE